MGAKKGYQSQNETVSKQPDSPAKNAPRDRNQETLYQPTVISSRASAKPPQRDYQDLFASHGSDPSPEEQPGSSPQKGNRGLKAQSANPPPREYHELFVGDESDASPAAKAKNPSPQKENKMMTPGSIAPKGGAGKHFLPSRLFETGDSQPGAPGTPEYSKENHIKPHPKKFNHFDFDENSEDNKREPAQSRPNTKHQAQWDFKDFMTPEQVPQKIRDQDVRHFGWGDDEPNHDSPIKHPNMQQPRPDSKANFEFRDDGTPAGGRRPLGHPRGQSAKNGMDLYRNHVIDDLDQNSNPEKKSHPLSTVTNLPEQRKGLDPHFSMADDSPTNNSSNRTSKPVPEARAKAVKMMNAQWETSDESPRPNHKTQNSDGADYGGLSLRDKGDYSSTNNRNNGIKTGGDGMGGKKGAERTWGIGSESDEDGKGRANISKFQPSRRQQAPKENSLWDT